MISLSLIRILTTARKLLYDFAWNPPRSLAYTAHRVSATAMLRKCADSQAGIGTGKTHTLIEIIQQLTRETPDNSNPSRVLVCGASNLAVDNILERLLALPAVDKIQKLKVTRIGHPRACDGPRGHPGIDIGSQGHTHRSGKLDARGTTKSSSGHMLQAALARDVKDELETTLGILSGKGKGVKGKGPRGAERRKMWMT